MAFSFGACHGVHLDGLVCTMQVAKGIIPASEPSHTHDATSRNLPASPKELHVPNHRNPVLQRTSHHMEPG